METLTKSKTNTTKMNATSFKIKSGENFTNFLKKFKFIEKGLLLELSPEKLRAESHSADRGIVKSSFVSLEDILEGTVPVDLIKIGIFNIIKVIDMFKHFEDTDELFLEVHWSKVGDENIATNLQIVSPNLTFNLKCSDTEFFTYVSQEMFDSLTTPIIEGKEAEFSFPREIFGKINSLCNFDSGEERLTISFKNGQINFKGESFNYKLGADVSDKKINFAFYKTRFASVDEENSDIILGTDKLLINSIESNTQVIIGRVS